MLSFCFQCANILEQFAEEDSESASSSGADFVTANRDNFLNLEANIYIAGSVEEGSTMYAGYWYADKQGFKRINLDKAVYIYDIAVFEGNVITAGIIDGNLSSYYWDPTKPSVWVNGIRYPIESNSITYSEIESILVVPH